MPIRINLKEIFPSDPQEINVDKLNFNFNKLLELGVGTPGPTGITGSPGPPGPIGPTGPQGERGATWWVDFGDPNLLTFTGLIDGDLYLNQDQNSPLDVYQYDEPTDTWSLALSIAAIINSYLIINGASPFSSGPVGTSTQTTDFVVFKRDAGPTGDYVEYLADIGRGTSNQSKNKMLWLSNFNETALAPNLSNFIFPADPKELYNSLLSIYAAHADAQESPNADFGRYHIEFGSLYNDGTNIRLSNLKHNLKGKFYKNYIPSANLSPTNTNNWINTAKFSLSVPEGTSISDIDQNSIFEFVTAKYNIQSGASRDELAVRIGPYESQVEQGAPFTHIVADGITFAYKVAQTGGLNANIGLANNYVSTYSRLNTREFFMLDTSPLMNGILLKNKTYVIGDTNVIGKISIGDLDPTSSLTVSGNASIGSGYGAIAAPANGAIIEGNVGIGSSSPSSKLTINGNASIGSSYASTPAPSNGAIIEGSVGIGSSNPLSKLTVNGNVSIGYTSAAPSNGAIIQGSVGIGTSSPNTSNLLSVNGSVSIGSGYVGAGLSAPSNGAIIQGSVGIGTSSPASTLTLSGNASIGSSYASIPAPSNGAIIQGSVGIGTSSPTQKLHVSGGSIRIDSGNLTISQGTSTFSFSIVSGRGQITTDSIVNFRTGSSDVRVDLPLLASAPNANGTPYFGFIGGPGSANGAGMYYDISTNEIQLHGRYSSPAAATSAIKVASNGMKFTVNATDVVQIESVGVRMVDEDVYDDWGFTSTLNTTPRWFFNNYSGSSTTDANDPNVIWPAAIFDRILYCWTGTASGTAIASIRFQIEMADGTYYDLVRAEGASGFSAIIPAGKTYKLRVNGNGASGQAFANFAYMRLGRQS